VQSQPFKTGPRPPFLEQLQVRLSLKAQVASSLEKMKLASILCVAATASAIAVPARTLAIRPSVSAFRSAFYQSRNDLFVIVFMNNKALSSSVTPGGTA
jgi:hypothetical protein